jgi:3-(3-hydroxy-phenyl)propionate hydroxylase/flavoprotein hydroxylase
MLDPEETAEDATRHEGVWSRVSRYLSKDDAEIIRVANYVFRSRIMEQWRRLAMAMSSARSLHNWPDRCGTHLLALRHDATNWKECHA